MVLVFSVPLVVVLLSNFLSKMNNERLNCVDVEQSDGGDDVELDEAAAPSLNPSMMSDTVFNVFKILVSRFKA